MIVLDTTVLVYAKAAHHPLRNPCRELIAAVADGATEATTSAEVIQEFVHVRARRRPRTDAAGLGRDYTELLAPLLPITADDLERGLSWFERHEQLGAFDAVLAAAATASGATALVSADGAFASLAEVGHHVTPDEAGVAGLLGDGSPRGLG